MKQLLLCIALLCGFVTVQAQSKTDSLAYQLQRKKINGMLEVRRRKFGQYDVSLSQHTGIFGLQTKKDIRRSNDILMDIVKTDDEIFRQLKILLDYRAFEQTQAQTHSKDAEVSVVGYMNVINKLRARLERVSKDADKAREQQEKKQNILYVIIGLMFLSILLLIIKKSRVKP